jgi:TATA-box binding protein (TBP) (component of TFIID and TFIIIB)
MEFIEKPFVIDTTLLNINNVNNFYIQMINTNFNIQFHINRSKLFQLLLDNNIDASFDPIIHACVNIKYYLLSKKTKTISIFVFESGSITIAGSNSCSEILEAYNFINKFILSNYNVLLTKDITPNLIIDFIKKIKF